VLNALALAAMVVVWAHYARFIRLPDITVLPVVLTGILAGARYIIQNGWLKRRIEARAAETQEKHRANLVCRSM